MNLTLTLILVPALALLLTAVLTPMIRGAALATRTVATVRSDRWHKKATPAIGGVAIFAGFGGAILVGTLLSPRIAGPLQETRAGPLGVSHWEGLVLAGSLLFGVGLVDDLLELRPVTKLAGQLMGAAVLVLSGIMVRLTGVYALDGTISLLWFVGVTNAMNLLDNMDGLAAGVGAVAGAVLSALFLMDGEVGLASLSLALSGSMLGFLAHNYPPARIFMGDSGSLFLGIFLSGLALSPAPGLSRSLLAVVGVPVLVLSVPLLDTTFVTVERLLEGRPVSVGGRDHTSHGLVALGVTEERAVWILWILAFLGGVAGLLLRSTERAVAGVLGGVLLVVLALVGAYLLSARHRGIAVRDGDEVQEGAEALYQRIFAFHQRVPFLAFAMDVVLVGLAYFAAYLVRWDPGRLGPQLAYFRASLPVVVAAKLLVFSWVGIYGGRWRHFGMEDALRVVRANLFATILTASALLLLERVGLSRGVLVIDFLICSGLTVAARFSFRMFEGAAGLFSGKGTPVVLVGPPVDAELLVRELGRMGEGGLRAVAVADANFGPSRGRFRGLPLYGGRSGLADAVRETGAQSVVVVRRRGRDDPDLPYTVRDHLKRHGALDVYVVSLDIRRWKGRAEPGGLRKVESTTTADGEAEYGEAEYGEADRGEAEW